MADNLSDDLPGRGTLDRTENTNSITSSTKTSGKSPTFNLSLLLASGKCNDEQDMLLAFGTPCRKVVYRSLCLVLQHGAGHPQYGPTATARQRRASVSAAQHPGSHRRHHARRGAVWLVGNWAHRRCRGASPRLAGLVVHTWPAQIRAR